VTLKTGEAIYIDSNTGHAYVTAENCDEALVLGVCASDDPALATSLMQMHDVTERALPAHANESRAGVRALRRPAA
jgi:mannose-6-phosphate isomerase class I